MNKNLPLRLIIVTASLLLFSFSPVTGQGQADTVIAKKLNYLLYPYIFYTPETQFAFGGGGMLYFRTTYTKFINPSKIVLGGYYTSNGQYYITVTPSLYFPGYSEVYLEADLNYGKEKAKYHGIGNDVAENENPEYETHSLNTLFELQINSFLLKGIKAGIIFDYSKNSVDAHSNDLLTNPNLRGKDGGDLGGLGLSYTKDNRNNLFYPGSGLLYKTSFTVYHDFIGSQFNYNRFLIDLRNYFAFKNEHIVALQFFGEFVSGGAPFFRLAELGGDQIMRGYFRGRYRDQQYAAAQIEYRKMLWWRFGIVVFGGAGQVSPDIDSFKVSKLKPSFGGGIRFVFDKKEKINLRFDIGFGENMTGVYFALEEAF